MDFQGNRFLVFSKPWSCKSSFSPIGQKLNWNFYGGRKKITQIVFRWRKTLLRFRKPAPSHRNIGRRFAVACTDEQDLSDAEIAEIKKILISQSISDYFVYRGNCPCPYNYDIAGRRCGARSAHTKPGGASPLCYESDVSDWMVKQYKDNSWLKLLDLRKASWSEDLRLNRQFKYEILCV